MILSAALGAVAFPVFAREGARFGVARAVWELLSPVLAPHLPPCFTFGRPTVCDTFGVSLNGPELVLHAFVLSRQKIDGDFCENVAEMLTLAYLDLLLHPRKTLSSISW